MFNVPAHHGVQGVKSSGVRKPPQQRRSARLLGLIGGRARPHAQLVLLAAHVDDDAADLLALLELLAYARQQLRARDAPQGAPTTGGTR